MHHTFRSAKAAFYLLAFLLIYPACNTPAARYERLLKQESKKTARQDSLWLGLYLGMTDSAFFADCLQLNHRQILRQGAERLSVVYDPGGFASPLNFSFYPDFEAGRIGIMNVWLSYPGWSPWNRRYSADSLLPRVKAHFDAIYGAGYLEIPQQIGNPIFVKIQANRQLVVWKMDERQVAARVTDLSVASLKEQERRLLFNLK